MVIFSIKKVVIFPLILHNTIFIIIFYVIYVIYVAIIVIYHLHLVVSRLLSSSYLWFQSFSQRSRCIFITLYVRNSHAILIILYNFFMASCCYIVAVVWYPTLSMHFNLLEVNLCKRNPLLGQFVSRGGERRGWPYRVSSNRLMTQYNYTHCDSWKSRGNHEPSVLEVNVEE